MAIMPKHFLHRVHYFSPTPTYMLNIFVNLKDIVHNASVTEGNRDFRGFRGVAMSLIPCESSTTVKSSQLIRSWILQSLHQQVHCMYVMLCMLSKPCYVKKYK